MMQFPAHITAPASTRTGYPNLFKKNVFDI